MTPPLPAITPVTPFLSLASPSAHQNHVRTQIPYALIGAAGAVGLYLRWLETGSGNILHLAGHKLHHRRLGIATWTWEIIPWQSHALFCHC